MRVVSLLSLLLLVSCFPSGQLDVEPIDDDDDTPSPECALRDLSDEGLPLATLGLPYEGDVRVADYDGPGVYTLATGRMPGGLSLAEGGAITGTPTELGTFDLWIRVTEADIDDAFGCVQLDVDEEAKDVSLGYVHDQRTALSESAGVQVGLWMRIAGGGEPGQDEVLLRPGLYRPGANGVHELGAGDDELVVLLPPDEVTVTVGGWQNADGEPIDSPSEHVGDGLFVAGEDTGELPFNLDHPDWDAVDSVLQVVPPDWCPKGLSGGPGDGSCQ